MRQSGRRSGKPDTRGAILAAARRAFGAHGYDRASVRGIAADAGVDPALVHHYFGTKEQLFQATVDIPVDPRAVLGPVLAGDPQRLGHRLVETVIGVWDSPAGTAAAALLRSASHHEWSARLLREFLTTQIGRRVTEALGLPPEQGRLRFALVASQMVGLITMRYLLRLEPVASLPRERLAALVGPAVQQYLTGPLPGDPHRPGSDTD